MTATNNKVSDEELLRAIWLLQVRTTARGCIDNYVGDRKGLASASSRKYAQDIHIISRSNLSVPLSNGHLRKRLVRLIDQGKVQWSLRNCTFWIDNELAKDVFDYACDWWANNGVPSGYDENSESMRCKKIDDFDSLVDRLENELVEKFGKFHGAIQ